MSNCQDVIPSNCVPWNGPSIPCLGLCKGDSVSTIIVKLATKLCETLEPYDLSTLSLECALELFDVSEPSSRTFASIFQLLIDNQCTLKELFDALKTKVDGITLPDTFVVDLKCLAQLDSYGNPIPYTESSVAQLFVNNICSILGEISYLNDKVVSLQEQIDNIDINPVVTEPSVQICIDGASNLSAPASTQIKRLANNLCDYKNALGSRGDAQTALGKYDPTLANDYGGFAGWIANPANALQALNNYEIVINNLLSRLKYIENNCCAPSCSSVTIGYGITKITDTTITVSFSSLYGVSIPDGFVDNGSYMVISQADVPSNNMTVYVPIDADYTTDEINISQFPVGSTLIFKVYSKFKNGDVECNNLIEKTWVYVGDTSVTPPATATLTLTVINASSIHPFIAASLNVPIAGNIIVDRVYADGFPDTACLTPASAALTYNNLGTQYVSIPAGNVGATLQPSTKTGYWDNSAGTPVVRYLMYNIIVNGIPNVTTGQVINIAGTDVTVVFRDTCTE